MAKALEAYGWSTTSPDLRDAVHSPSQFWSRTIQHVAAADIVIGHSGAGAVLPIIADRVGAAVTVFVDAVVAGEADAFAPAARFTEFLDTIPTVDGLLAPWHEWWPSEMFEQLVPDESLRRKIIAENPRVPRSFYDESVSLPEKWWIRPAAYLQLSPAYDEDRSRATRWGWPTRSVDGQHLDLVTNPELVAEHVHDLVARCRHG